MSTLATAFALLAAAAAVLGQPARASEHKLEVKLVTMAVEVKNFEVANVEGQNVALMKPEAWHA